MNYPRGKQRGIARLTVARQSRPGRHRPADTARQDRPSRGQCRGRFSFPPPCSLTYRETYWSAPADRPRAAAAPGRADQGAAAPERPAPGRGLPEWGLDRGGAAQDLAGRDAPDLILILYFIRDPLRQPRRAERRGRRHERRRQEVDAAGVRSASARRPCRSRWTCHGRATDVTSERAAMPRPVSRGTSAAARLPQRRVRGLVERDAAPLDAAPLGGTGGVIQHTAAPGRCGARAWRGSGPTTVGDQARREHESRPTARAGAATGAGAASREVCTRRESRGSLFKNLPGVES